MSWNTVVGMWSCREYEGPSPRAVRTGVRVARGVAFLFLVTFVDLVPVSLQGASAHPSQSGWFQSSCREPELSFLPVLTQFVKFLQAPGGGPLATPNVAWLNELQAIGGGTSGTISYAYDANGNQTSRTEGTLLETFGYDFLNRLSSYVKTSGSTQEAVAYGYMPTGERHLKHTTVQSGNPLDEKRWFMYDGADIATEYTQTGAGSLNLSVSYLQSLGIDSKLARITAPSGALHYYVPDALGSVMQLVDTTQQSVNREVTTAWGEPLPAFTPVLGVPDRFGFGQREKDSESGLGHHRYRTLDYRTGRFLQNEPMIGNRAQEHYAYAGNNPVNHTDPNGLFWWWHPSKGAWEWQPLPGDEDPFAYGLFGTANPPPMDDYSWGRTALWVIARGDVFPRPATRNELRSLGQVVLGDVTAQGWFSTPAEELRVRGITQEDIAHGIQAIGRVGEIAGGTALIVGGGPVGWAAGAYLLSDVGSSIAGDVDPNYDIIGLGHRELFGEAAAPYTRTGTALLVGGIGALEGTLSRGNRALRRTTAIEESAFGARSLGAAEIAPHTGSGRVGMTGRVRGRAPEFHGGRITESGFLDAAERYLGPGYREASPGRYVSADGLRQVRFSAHEVRGPTLHGHFEAFDKPAGRIIENTRVDIVGN